MAKLINKVATVVAIVAAIAAVVLMFVPGGQPYSLIMFKVAAAAGAVASVSAFVMKRPSPSLGTDSNWKADPQAGIPYVLGRTAVGGNIVHHASFGKDNKFAFFVTVLSYGPIQEYEALEVDKTVINFSGSSAINVYPTIMWKKHQLGATPEASALVPVNSGVWPDWGTAYKLSGLAAELWELKYDVKGDVNYNNGIPVPLRIIKGVKVYDPRLDSTVAGGSGPCRALDESTYVYDDNPWLHALTWALGRMQAGKRVMGVGIPAAALAIASYAEAASIADANDWTCGGQINSTDDKWDCLKAMAEAGGGMPVRYGAQLSCIVNVPRVSLDTIRKEDLAGDARIVGSQPRRFRINGIVPRYRSEAHDWEIVPASEVRVPAYVTEDGGERTKEIEYRLVQDVDQAAQLARYEIENLRERGPITLMLKPEWVGYKPGDCLTVDIAELGLSAQTCIVRNRSFDPASGVVTLEMMTETPGKHVAAGVSGTPPPPTDTNPPSFVLDAPQPGSWAVTATSVTSGGVTSPALVITGACDNAKAEFVVFEYRVYGSAVWNAAGAPELPTVVRKEILGLNPSTLFEVAVSYMAQNVRSARLIITPGGGSATVPPPYVTPGDIVIDVTPPAVPSGLALTSAVRLDDDGTQKIFLTATWNANTDTDLAYYRLQLREAGGNFVTYQTSGTRYEVQVLAGVTYEARLQAVDIHGNVSATYPGGSTVISHTAASDTVAPSAPTGFTATAGLRSINLLWTNPTVNDLDHVDIYENTTNASGSATRIASVMAESGQPGFFAREGLATGLLRYYWLKAVDTSGNASVFSLGSSATTGFAVTADFAVGTLNGDRILAGSIFANKLFVSGNATQDALPAGITIGVGGTQIGTVDTRANDPLVQANTKTTKLTPGLVLISGSTTLSDWRNGGDNTKIEGGSIAANTVTANKLNIGQRGVQIGGIEFTANWNGTTNVVNTLHWSAGTIVYVDDAGVTQFASIPSGTATYGSTAMYVYWVKGATSLSTTTSAATANGANNIVFATWQGGTDLVVTYGRTIIDGDHITTNTLNANVMLAGTISSRELSTGLLITDSAQIGSAIITTLKIAGDAIIVPNVTTFADKSIPSSGVEQTVGTTGTVTIGDSTDGKAMVTVSGHFDGTVDIDAACQIYLDLSVDGGAFTQVKTFRCGSRSTSSSTYSYFPFSATYQITSGQTIAAKVRAKSIPMGPSASNRASALLETTVVFEGAQR